MAQLGVGVLLLLVCVSVAVLMRARTVIGERSGALTSRHLGAGTGTHPLSRFAPRRRWAM